MACGSPVSASGSGLEGLGEPVGAALPGIRGGRRVERRAVVGEEAVGGARVNHDLDVRVVLLHELAHLARVGWRWTRVLLDAEGGERGLDVLRYVEARYRSRMVRGGQRHPAVAAVRGDVSRLAVWALGSVETV